MPEYDPNKHGEVRISTREIDFVRNYTELESSTFANAYRSALAAGYSEWMARIIVWYKGRDRIREVRRLMQDPTYQMMEKHLRELPDDYAPPIPYRTRRRMKARMNKKLKALLSEIEQLERQT